jgi:hypothetical protein
MQLFFANVSRVFAHGRIKQLACCCRHDVLVEVVREHMLAGMCECRNVGGPECRCVCVRMFMEGGLADAT